MTATHMLPSLSAARRLRNPPQQWEVQPIADKLDELINTLRR